MMLSSCKYSYKILSFLYELLYLNEECISFHDVMVRIREFVDSMIGMIYLYNIYIVGNDYKRYVYPFSELSTYSKCETNRIVNVCNYLY